MTPSDLLTSVPGSDILAREGATEESCGWLRLDLGERWPEPSSSCLGGASRRPRPGLGQGDVRPHHARLRRGARGAKVEHRFIVENIYEEDAHIKSVSSSCGCSTPQVSRKLLKTWEKAEILVTVDTRGFLGRKDATITVVFDQPFPAEVQLHVHTYIRSDIVVQPGAALFGSVMQGAGAQQTLAVSYAGRDDWRIVRVECADPSIEASAAETSRTPGQVGYSLSVRLKPDAPPGYIRDQLVLVTNDYDARAARVPVAVEGLVVAALSVRPSPLMMGVAEAGRPVTRNLVVQGGRRFASWPCIPATSRFSAGRPTTPRRPTCCP